MSFLFFDSNNFYYIKVIWAISRILAELSKQMSNVWNILTWSAAALGHWQMNPETVISAFQGIAGFKCQPAIYWKLLIKQMRWSEGLSCPSPSPKGHWKFVPDWWQGLRAGKNPRAAQMKAFCKLITWSSLCVCDINIYKVYNNKSTKIWFAKYMEEVIIIIVIFGDIQYQHL